MNLRRNRPGHLAKILGVGAAEEGVWFVVGGLEYAPHFTETGLSSKDRSKRLEAGGFP